MLQNLVKTAKGINGTLVLFPLILLDMQSVARYLLYMMKTIPDLNANKTEQNVVTDLMEAVQNIPNIGFSNIEVDMVGLPLVKKVTPLKYVSHREHSPNECSASAHLYPVPKDSSSKKSIWIYDPFKKKEEKKLFWVQNELAEVKVELVNPTNYELEIQSISLR